MADPKILTLINQINSINAKISTQAIKAYQTKDKIVTNNTTINLESSKKIGSELSLTNNSVKIGKNITAVKVYAQIFFQYIQSDQNYFWIEIRKNGSVVAKKLTNYGKGTDQGNFCTADVSSEFLSVKEGDLITLNTGDVANKKPTTRSGEVNTFLQVVKL